LHSIKYTFTFTTSSLCFGLLVQVTAGEGKIFWDCCKGFLTAQTFFLSPNQDSQNTEEMHMHAYTHASRCSTL